MQHLLWQTSQRLNFRVCGATLISPPNPAGKKVPMWATTGRVQRNESNREKPKRKNQKMVMKNEKIIERAEQAIIESPLEFEIEKINGKKEKLWIYPFSAGRLIKAAGLIRKMKLTAEALTGDKPFDEMLRVAEECTEDMMELIALATLRDKQDMEKLEERKEMLMWSPTMTQVAQANLLQVIVTQCFYADFVMAFKLVKMLPEIVSQRTKIADLKAKETPMAEKPFGDSHKA